jgi:hypothetical protein
MGIFQDSQHNLGSVTPAGILNYIRQKTGAKGVVVLRGVTAYFVDSHGHSVNNALKDGRSTRGMEEVVGKTSSIWRSLLATTSSVPFLEEPPET